MLTKTLEIDNDYSIRYSSFTERSKQRLELYRRRSLQQTNDDSRSLI